MEEYDAVIIGGGLSGLAAARELGNHGLRPLVLEAKDRLGGRAWTDRRLGKKLEMGGTWFHWYEPHIWSEVTKYGLETVRHPPIEAVYWNSGKKPKKFPPELLYTFLEKRMKAWLEEAAYYFPHPYRPLDNHQALLEIDHLSARDRLNRMKLTPTEYTWMESLWALIFHGRPEEAAYTHSLRWLALSLNNWKLLLETFSAFQLKNGTEELVSCIAGDISGEIRLSCEAASVEKQESGSYTVTARDGQTFTGRTVIATLPLSILHTVSFDPPLSPLKRRAGGEKQVSRGVKVWAKISSRPDPFTAVAPAHYPLNYIQYEYDEEEGAYLVCFGSDADRLDISNCTEVERAIQKVLPDIEVTDCTGHDWAHDKYCRQTWSMYSRNQFTRYHQELNRSEEGVFLAGDELADGWAGLMDGALESGVKTAGKARHFLTRS